MCGDVRLESLTYGMPKSSGKKSRSHQPPKPSPALPSIQVRGAACTISKTSTSTCRATAWWS